MPMAASMARFIMPIPPPKYPPYTATISSKIDAPTTAALLESCEMPAEMRPVRCLPKAKSSVAPSSSHGKTFRKVCAGVLMSRIAPANPPTMLVRMSGIITRRGMFSFMRYAPPLAVVPTQRASVLVALAGTGGTPVKSRAGNATKLPPPATALMAPPSAPARNRKMALWKFKRIFYHDCGLLLQWRPLKSSVCGYRERTTGKVFGAAKSFLDNGLGAVYERCDLAPFRHGNPGSHPCGSQGGFKRRAIPLN